jgi:hypothetical protein
VSLLTPALEDRPARDAVADVENALVAHWSLFGRWRAAELRDQDGLLSYETPIAHLPYNGVIRTRLGNGPAAHGLRPVARITGMSSTWTAGLRPRSRPASRTARLSTTRTSRRTRI